MFCLNCGKPISDHARFCAHCGTSRQPGSTPAVTPSQVSVPPQPPVQNRKKFPLWIPIVIGVSVLLLIAVIAGFFLLFGKKTVYLRTESVSESKLSTTTVCQEYDDQGCLIGYETITKYNGDYSYLSGFTREIQYTYDQDGKLTGAELEISHELGNGIMDYTLEVEYLYEKDVLEDIEVDHSEGETDFDFSFTDEGWIEQVTALHSGEEYMVYNHRYHENGILKSSQMEYISTDYRNEYLYNEQGNVTEISTYHNGEISTKTEYEYQGDFPSRITDYFYEDGEEIYRSVTSIESVMDGDTLKELSILLECEEDGETIKLQLTGEVEWDGLEGTWEPKAKGDLDEFGYDRDEDFLKAEIEMDEHGNLLRFAFDNDEFTLRSFSMIDLNTFFHLDITHEYTAIKIPRNYSKPSTLDPRYSLSWAS